MFYANVLNELIDSGVIERNYSVLVICGGRYDREVLGEVGFENVTITNLDDDYAENVKPFSWEHQDAENLAYPPNSFDVAIVHAGLHHCYSPHRALLEMYRVASKVVIVFEARDSLLLRLSKKIGLTVDYEIESVGVGPGGVAHTMIPNFVYRWTENEVFKTVCSTEPRYIPRIRFFYGLRLPYDRFAGTGRSVGKYVLYALSPIAKLVHLILPKQGNEFGFAIEKGGTLLPWLKYDSNEIQIDRAAVKQMGRSYRFGKY